MMNQTRGERRRIFYLIVIMAVIAVLVGSVTALMLYRTALNEEKIRLAETAQSQARLIEAMYHFYSEYGQGFAGSPLEATLSQVRAAHEQYVGFGETGEFTLAKLENGQIVFLLSHRHFDLDDPQPVPFDTDLAEPMRRALSGESGTVVGLDYRGERVVAAYEPVAGLNLGIVAKIDLSEIRMPYTRSIFYLMIFSTVIVGLGALIFFRIGNPMVEQISESLEALRESEEKFRTAFQGAGVGMVLVDKTGRYIQVNAAMTKLLGYSEEELLRMKINDLTYSGDPDQNSNLVREIWEGMSDGISIEKRYVGKDGKVIWGLTSISPIKGYDGKTQYLFGQFQDITLRKQAEEEVNNLNENLENMVVERTAQLESFTYSVAHDLRAPLRAIAGLSEILADEYENKIDAQADQYFERIIDASKRMDNLITDLLSLSQLGRQALNPEQIEMSQLVGTIIEEMKGSIADREIEFRIHPSQPECHPISADKSQIKIALSNLFSNAVKFTRPVSNPVIEFGCLLQDDENVYYIRDNGIGFNMSYVDKLFNPFQRLHNEDEYEGLGIGLAIVDQIIRRHNGRIWVESEENNGTTFYFILGEIVPGD